MFQNLVCFHILRIRDQLKIPELSRPERDLAVEWTKLNFKQFLDTISHPTYFTEIPCNLIFRYSTQNISGGNRSSLCCNISSPNSQISRFKTIIFICQVSQCKRCNMKSKTFSESNGADYFSGSVRCDRSSLRYICHITTHPYGHCIGHGLRQELFTLCRTSSIGHCLLMSEVSEVIC